MKQLASAAAAVILLAASLGGCMVEQELTLNQAGSGLLEAQGYAMPFAARAFDDLAALGGYDDAGELYAAVAAGTEEDLSRRPGIEEYAVELIGDHGWTANVRFSDVEELLGGADGIPIAELTGLSGISTLSIRFDRDRADGLSQLVPMLREPALSPFNPAETAGFSEESYIRDVLGFTFGEENLPAIRAARVSMRVVVPGPVASVEGGRLIDEHTVLFETAFTRLLVPDNPVAWRVSWETPR